MSQFADITGGTLHATLGTTSNISVLMYQFAERAGVGAIVDVIKWNHIMREKRISEIPDRAQAFMERYIPQVIPNNRRVYCWFDVYDIEEQRI